MASPFCGKDFCMFVVEETNNVNPWVAWISGKNTGCSQFYNVLQWFTLSLCCRICSNALMIGFLSFKRPLSSPCQSRHDDCPKTFQAEVWNAWIISRAFGFRLCASAAVDKNEKAELRWFRSEASGNVIPTRRWSWEMLRREVEWLWYDVVVDQDLWYSMNFLWYHINPYRHIHLPTSLVSKPGDSRDLTL